MLKRMEDMAKEIRERMRGGNGTIQPSIYLPRMNYLKVPFVCTGYP